MVEAGPESGRGGRTGQEDDVMEGVQKESLKELGFVPGVGCGTGLRPIVC